MHHYFWLASMYCIKYVLYTTFYMERAQNFQVPEEFFNYSMRDCTFVFKISAKIAQVFFVLKKGFCNIRSRSNKRIYICLRAIQNAIKGS